MAVEALEVIELLVMVLRHYKDVQLLYVLHQIIRLQLVLEAVTLVVQLILLHLLVHQIYQVRVMVIHQVLILIFNHQAVVIH